MTPIKLQMTAFGPYVKYTELNFAAELGDEKIFLIHGTTGAGKTTILDAISYALYGETSGKARKGEDMRSKGVPDDVKTEVEFTFRLGDDTFRAYRSPAQDIQKKRGGGSTSISATAELYRNENLIATKDRAVKNKVTELLGFTAEQFRQVILLPQGDFKKFISSDAGDRQKVLNVLFDTEPYQKVEAALAERAKVTDDTANKLKADCDNLANQLKDAGSQSPEEVERKLSAAKANVAALQKISAAAQTQLTDGTILADKFAALQRTTSELNAAQIQLAEAEKSFATAQAEYLRREGETARRKELDTLAHDLEAVQATLVELDKKQSALKTANDKFQKAEKTFDDCEEKATRYATRLNKLTNDQARLDCEKILGEILKLETNLAAAQEKVSVAEKNLTDAQMELTRLQIVNSAAFLASKLKDGKPCPVCGSLEHPAIIAAAIPTLSELKAADETVARRTREKSQAETFAARIAGELAAKEKQRDAYADKPELTAAQKNFVSLQKTLAELADCQKRIKSGNEYVESNKSALEAARKDKDAAKILVSKIAGEIDGLQSKVPEKYSSDRQRLVADLTAAQREFNQLDAAWQAAQKQFNATDRTKSARVATLRNVQKNFDDLQAAVKDKTPPDLNSLDRQARTASANLGAAIGEVAKLESDFNKLKELSAKFVAVKAKYDAAQKIADMWKRLSDVANATGKGEADLKISFQRYYLSTMFNEVVNEANHRFEKMSGGHYLFQMKDKGRTMAKTAGLNLEILDEYTGKPRPIETLSGGELFLASLSLALGLAAVVRNRVGGIRLDTIFIDEGFGSLDMASLDLAISTIIEQSGGRLVGIISHVEELKNQLPVRLEVKAGKAGSTATFRH